MESIFRNKFWRILLVIFAFLGVALLVFTLVKWPADKARARELEQTKQRCAALDYRSDSLMAEVEQRDSIYCLLMDSLSRNNDMLDHIPSALPLKISDLNYVASLFGYRIDPIYKVDKFHSGIDFTSTLNAEALATGDGVVEDLKSDEWGYGNMVVIDHGYGFKSRYAHLNKFAVEKGQEVKRGEVVGYIGCTGKATGVHLHYEVMKDDQLIDPADYLGPTLREDDQSVGESEEPQGNQEKE